MNRLEEEIKHDQELFSYFRDRNTTLCQDNFNFLMEHPEVKRLLNDYLSNILLHKPDDVFKFTKDYFKFLSDKGESHKFVILVGPNSVGKTTMINKIIEEFPDYFERPVFRSTVKNEGGFKIMDIEEYNIALTNNMFIYSKFDNNNQEYISIEKQEIERIQQTGKIAIIEIDLNGAKKLQTSEYDANFIGIIPPSLDALRERIKQHTKLNTENINRQLEIAQEEIKEIEKLTFFCFRITNDDLDAGIKDVKNAVISLYPKLKYSDEMIEEIKNIDPKASIIPKEDAKENEDKKDSNEGNEGIKEEPHKENKENNEIKEEEEKANESENEAENKNEKEEKKEEKPDESKEEKKGESKEENKEEVKQENKELNEEKKQESNEENKEEVNGENKELKEENKGESSGEIKE